MNTTVSIKIFLTLLGIGHWSYSPAKPTPAEKPKYDIQFFGDLYISKRVLKSTKTTSANKNLFIEINDLLNSSIINIANFEGTIASNSDPYVLKKYLLKMPSSVPQMINEIGINGVTLANNHTLDYGLPGLIDTMWYLGRAKIKYSGAGFSFQDAIKPMVFSSSKGAICIFSFSKTFPEDFWAKKKSFGTAHPSLKDAKKVVESSKEFCSFIFTVFHWGAEGSRKAKPYQRHLAREMINSGASAVLGHHPHVIQEIEFYKNSPIIYSLGNFIFGTIPVSNIPEGMSAGFIFKNSKIHSLVITPINVNNLKHNFIVSPFSQGNQKDPISTRLVNQKNCRKKPVKTIIWECFISKSGGN